MIQTQHYINGQWQDSTNGATRDIICPTDESIIAKVAEGSAEDAKLAIAAARAAFNGEWRDTTTRSRAILLNQIAALIDRDAEILAQLETLNTGKTLTESRTDMGDIAATFRYFAGLVATGGGNVNEAPEHVISRTVHEPIGVCGLITPWNYPLLQAAWKIAPALGAGNTIVMKPSELTPLTTWHFTKLLTELNLPAGVFNLVTSGGAAGAELSASLDVDLISFTGGALTGERIMKAATGNFKRIALELGGKNPNIVFADANLEVALDYALNAAFFHAGQVCSAGSRLIVESSIYDEFTTQLAARMRKIKIGHGVDDATQMGPVQSAMQHEKILTMIKMGIDEGATLACGGKRPIGAEYAQGYWLEPTLLTNVTADMKIAQEEIFGPVITAERFETEAEVLRLANDTPYGLAGAVWTNDLDKANRMSRGMRFGTVWVNDYHPYFPEAPWGGFKASGIGRELSRIGLDEYTELKHSYINLKPQVMGWFGV